MLICASPPASPISYLYDQNHASDINGLRDVAFAQIRYYLIAPVQLNKL